MIAEFTHALKRDLQEEIDNLSGDLARGQPASFDEYRRLVGKIQGLELAKQRLTDLAKKVVEDDDD